MSIRQRQDVEAILNALRTTRGRPPFRTGGHLQRSSSGADVPHTRQDGSVDEGHSQQRSSSSQGPGHGQRSSSRTSERTAPHGAAYHLYPFRCSSTTPGIPEKQPTYIRSASQNSARSARDNTSAHSTPRHLTVDAETARELLRQRDVSYKGDGGPVAAKVIPALERRYGTRMGDGNGLDAPASAGSVKPQIMKRVQHESLVAEWAREARPDDCRSAALNTGPPRRQDRPHHGRGPVVVVPETAVRHAASWGDAFPADVSSAKLAAVDLLKLIVPYCPLDTASRICLTSRKGKRATDEALRQSGRGNQVVLMQQLNATARSLLEVPEAFLLALSRTSIGTPPHELFLVAALVEPVCERDPDLCTLDGLVLWKMLRGRLNQMSSSEGHDATKRGLVTDFVNSAMNMVKLRRSTDEIIAKQFRTRLILESKPQDPAGYIDSLLNPYVARFLRFGYYLCPLLISS